PQLDPVAASLLEVVAEDLVQLDELGAVLFEPGCEALVQLGADRFRQRLVGGVADQDVAETEAVLTHELRPVGSDQLFAHERRQAMGYLSLLGCDRLYGTAVHALSILLSP